SSYLSARQSADFLTHPDVLFSYEVRREAPEPRRQQHDHGRSHFEPPELGAALEPDAAPAAVAAHDRARVRRDRDAIPDGRNSGNEHRADQHDGEGSERAVEVANQPFI